MAACVFTMSPNQSEIFGHLRRSYYLSLFLVILIIFNVLYLIQNKNTESTETRNTSFVEIVENAGLYNHVVDKTMTTQ